MFPQRFPRGHKVLAMSCLKNEAQKSFEFRASSYPPADPHRCSGRATPHGRRSERGAQTFREPSPGSARFFLRDFTDEHRKIMKDPSSRIEECILFVESVFRFSVEMKISATNCWIWVTVFLIVFDRTKKLGGAKVRMPWSSRRSSHCEEWCNYNVTIM